MTASNCVARAGRGSRSARRPHAYHPRATTAAGRCRPWVWARRIGTWVFFALIAWLLVTQARTIDWGDVQASLAQLPRSALLIAGMLAACSFVLYSTYDLLGRHLTGHTLGTGTVMGVTFISYAFNLNLGSLIGGVAFRVRLYSRLGLRGSTITHVLGFSMLTNWLGYLVMAGAVLCFWPPSLPPNWELGNSGLRSLGIGLLLLAAAYLTVCACMRGRSWRVRGYDIGPPSMRIALLQLAMSCANWALMGGIIWFLLQRQVEYPHVLAVLLVAAVAGVVTHVPAGLGVLEAVFVTLLSHQLPQGRLLAALLAYRALYYLLPMAVATAAYVTTELRAKRQRRRGAG